MAAKLRHVAWPMMISPSSRMRIRALQSSISNHYAKRPFLNPPHAPRACKCPAASPCRHRHCACTCPGRKSPCRQERQRCNCVSAPIHSTHPSTRPSSCVIIRPTCFQYASSPLGGFACCEPRRQAPTHHSANELDLLGKIRLDALRDRLSLEVDGADVADVLGNALILHKSLDVTTRHHETIIAPTQRPSPAPHQRSSPTSPNGSVPNPLSRCCPHRSTSRPLHGAVPRPPQT